MRRLIPFLIVCFTLALGAQGAAAATLYAPEYSEDRVSTFELGANNAFSTLTGSPFVISDGGLSGFATTPDGRKGFAAYLFSGGVRGVSIGANGEVTPAQDKIGLGSNGVYNVAVSPDSRFAYAATRYYPGSGPAGIRAYSFSDGGALSEVAGSPFENPYEFLDLAMTPNGKFLYGTVGMGLIAFSVNQDGSLTSLGPTGGVVARWAMASPDGRFLFVGGEDGGNAALFAFSIGADGLLTEVGLPVVFGGTSGQLPALSPDGRFIYAPEQNEGVIHAVRVNPDGSLAAVGSVAVTEVRSAVVSPDSKSLFAWIHGAGDTLSRSTIGPDGVPGPFQTVAAYNPGEGVRMHFRTGFGAVANFTAKPSTKPLTMIFDGAASTAKQGALGSLDWVFGDGAASANGGAVATHKFAKPGVYEVTLTARDSGGCATERIYLGQTAPCMGSPESVKTVKLDTPPWITSMSVSPKRVGSKSKIKFKLTEKARVTFVVQRPVVGRMVGKSCRKQTSKNRKAKRCMRWLRASKAFRANGKKGSNSVKFKGKVGRKALKRGRYRLVATAVDSAKGKSPQRTASFRKR